MEDSDSCECSADPRRIAASLLVGVPFGTPPRRFLRCLRLGRPARSGLAGRAPVVGVIVQEYGGSSVAGVEKIQRVAERVAQARSSGRQVVVVVSAMGGTTDELLSLAQKISGGKPHRRELDMLLTAGERISMALLGMALHSRGVEAVSFTGSQSRILTGGPATHA